MNPSIPAEHELQRLLSNWADDALTDEDFARLDQLLSTDPQARQAYRHYVHLCENLAELVVPSSSVVEPEMPRPLTVVENSAPARAHAGRAFSRPAFWLAACSVAAVSWVLLQSAREGVDQNAAAAGENVAHLAVVTDVRDGVWERQDQSTHPAVLGSALEPGRCVLAAGQVEIAFASGVKVLLRGPAELDLQSATRAKLYRGELSAHVPEGAEGFVVDTPSVEVVDLGTEFGISVNAAGATDVHVFQGVVETRVLGSDETPGSLLRLTTAETRRFLPDLRKPLETQFDASRFPEFEERRRSELLLQGAVCELSQPPVSVDADQLESNDFILLFEEQREVRLPRPLPVSFSEPGRYDGFRERSRRLPRDTAVTSYLLHFDSLPVRGRPRRLRLDGSVTFPRPILGVIAAGKLLMHTDGILGSPQTHYPSEKSRGLDSTGRERRRERALDVITLSEDRRTLHVSFSVAKSSDQVRVLVEAENQE